MDTGTRNAAIAAAIILVGFGLFAFFLIFWLRGRAQNRDGD